MFQNSKDIERFITTKYTTQKDIKKYKQKLTLDLQNTSLNQRISNHRTFNTKKKRRENHTA
jgi:hypothetical protein